MFESLVDKKRLLKRDSNRTVIFTLTFSELVMDVGGGGGGGGGEQKDPPSSDLSCISYTDEKKDRKTI